MSPAVAESYLQLSGSKKTGGACSGSSAHWHFGIVQIVELLLQHGALVDAIDDDHRTALHEAALSGRFQVVPVQLHDANYFTEL